jgi:lantibiotic modifying enzyme
MIPAGYGLETDVGAVASGAVEWVRDAVVRDGDRARWRTRPDEDPHGERPDYGLYAGSAGVVLALAHLAELTGDVAYRDDALAGARELAAHEDDIGAGSLPLPGSEDTLYHGRAGAAYALAAVGAQTGDAVCLEAAARFTAGIAARARPDGDGVAWTGEPALLVGDAGIVLHLLAMAELLDEPGWAELAARAGTAIAARAEPDDRGGVRWLGFDSAWFGQSQRVYWPGFLGGTAGIAFTLARLADVTGDERFLRLARRGAEHLTAIATRAAGGALVPLRDPDPERLHYLGLCHGPVGTARLFVELHRQTGEPYFLEWTRRLANGMLACGVPDLRSPGLWNVDSQCCGLAGIVDFFLALWHMSGAEDDLAVARRAGAQIVGRALRDGPRYRWYQALTRTVPASVTADIGYFTGALGIATALFHLASAEQGRFVVLATPDNPFAALREPAL